MAEDCIFCQIIQGKAPARIVYQDERVTAFWDVNPRMPVHLLVVPNKHIESLDALDTKDVGLLGQIILTARRLASEQGIGGSGYRLVINNGPDAGQSVSHLHLHLIGGRRMPVFFPTP
ncbi:MAG: histidine triad nucleotide-binding protein [Anaerolineaceae bacterium]